MSNLTSSATEYRYRREERSLAQLQGPKGLPFIGRSFQILTNPLKEAQWCAARYGQIFRSDAFGVRGVVLLGPEANSLVLRDADDNFSSWLGWYPTIGKLFDGGLLVRDFDDHRRHRRIVQSGFSRAALNSYREQMGPLIDAAVKSWADQGVVAFYDVAKRLTLDVAATIFLGVSLRGNRGDDLSRLFLRLISAGGSLLRLPIPGTPFARGLRARHRIAEVLRRYLESNKEIGRQSTFASLLETRRMPDNFLSDQEIVDHLIFLVMAAHETTTSGLTSTIYYLAKHPDWQAAVREEIRAHMSGPADEESLSKLETTQSAFMEAIRLHPPVPAIPRRCVRSFEFGGYEIPGNAIVTVIPAFTHYLPEWWSRPTVFDPDRFSTNRAEHRRHPYIWVPFGGGPHLCTGMQLSIIESKMIIAALLRNHRLELIDGYRFSQRYYPFPKPRHGLPIRIRRL